MSCSFDIPLSDGWYPYLNYQQLWYEKTSSSRGASGHYHFVIYIKDYKPYAMVGYGSERAARTEFQRDHQRDPSSLTNHFEELLVSWGKTKDDIALEMIEHMMKYKTPVSHEPVNFKPETTLLKLDHSHLLSDDFKQFIEMGD